MINIFILKVLVFRIYLWEKIGRQKRGFYFNPLLIF